MEAVGLPARIEAADLVITGEGSFDAQSLLGKVAGGVIRAAREVGVPVVVLCGRSEVGVDGVVVESLVERVGEDRARVDARIALEDLAASVAERAPALSSRP
jgi:glycerate kinase